MSVATAGSLVDTHHPAASVLLLRLLLSLLLGSMIITPSVFQPSLDAIYAILSRSHIYKASIFETVWTVLIYAVIEPSYTYRFAHHPELRLSVQKDQDVSKPRPKMTRPQRRIREGLTYITPLLAMDLTMIKKFGGVSGQDMALSGNYELSGAEMSESFLTPTLHNFSWKSPLQTQRALPTAPPTSRQLVSQLALSILIYDAAFFWFHLALHKIPHLKALHAVHHRHQEIYPQITNRLDIVERLGLVLLANFSLNIIGSHVLTRTLFVPVFVWLLVDIHSGLDQEWGYDKLLPKGWAGGSKRHSFHHQYGTRYYEPFFNWWDDGLQRIQSWWSAEPV